MFCTKCGNRVDDFEAASCPSCGADLGIAKKDASKGGRGEASGGATVASDAPVKEPSGEGSEGNPGETSASDDGEKGVNAAEKKSKKAPIIIAIVVIACIAVAAAVFYSMEQQRIAEEERAAAERSAAIDAAYNAIDESRIQEIIADSEELMSGSASPDLVEKVEYELNGFTISGKDKSDDSQKVRVSGEAEIENEYFKETAKMNVAFSLDENDMSYELDEIDIDSVDITPLRGIKSDPSKGLTNIAESDMTFSAEDKECRVNVASDVVEHWFGTTGTNTAYTYRFENDEWAFVGELSNSGLVSIKGIYGPYVDTRDGATQRHGFYTDFKVSAKTDIKTDEVLSNVVHVSWWWEPGGGVANKFAGNVGAELDLTLELDGENLKIVKSESANSKLDVSGITGYFDPEGIQFTGGSWFAAANKTGQSGGADLSMNDLRLTRSHF